MKDEIEYVKISLKEYNRLKALDISDKLEAIVANPQGMLVFTKTRILDDGVFHKFYKFDGHIENPAEINQTLVNALSEAVSNNETLMHTLESNRLLQQQLSTARSTISRLIKELNGIYDKSFFGKFFKYY
jgi:hypothetical protein